MKKQILYNNCVLLSVHMLVIHTLYNVKSSPLINAVDSKQLKLL